MPKSKSDVALEKTRSETGKFVKGVSGNPKGRPPKPKASALPDDFHTDIGDDSIKTLRKLMVTTTDRHEKFKLAKELAPFDAPKKSSVESYATEIKTIEIKWLNEDPAPKVIEGIVENVLEEDDNGS